jgi:hypothetical protein
MRSGAATGALVIMVLAAVTARAQDEGVFAQKRYDDALRLFQARRFQEALDEFRASYSILASPNTRLMIAHCLAELRRLAEAFGEYERTAREATDRAAMDPRYAQTESAARGEAQILRRRIGFVRLRLDREVVSPRVSVAGRAIPAEALALPVPADPGAVQIVLEVEGRRLVRRVDLRAGEARDVQIELGPPPPTQPEPRAEPSRTPGGPDPAPKRRGPHVATWIALAVGGTGLVTSGVLGLMAREQHDDLEAACMGGACPAGHEEEVDRGRRLQLWTNVSLGVGVAATALGGALFWLSSDSAGQAAASARTRLVGGPRGGWVSWAIDF